MRTCALFFLALAASAQSPYSLEGQAELGARLAADVLKKSTPTVHEDVRAYVQRLGNHIADQMPASPAKYRFAFAVIVEDSPDALGTHEPVMIPGGYIIVSEHLIRAARDEAEFAGMLAHAMAHTAAGHMARMSALAQIAQGKLWIPGPDGRSEAMKVTPGDLPRFAQAFEDEADSIATGALAASGLDPAAFARYIGRTESATSASRERVERIDSVIRGLPARSYFSSDEFLSIQRELQ